MLKVMKDERAIFMEDHIPERANRSLLIGRQTSKWSLWDVIKDQNGLKA